MACGDTALMVRLEAAIFCVRHLINAYPKALCDSNTMAFLPVE